MKHPHRIRYRKLLAFVLALSILATLTGCRKKDDTPGTTGGTQAPPASTAAPTPAPTQTEQPETTAPPPETTVPPTTEAPVTEPPTEPTAPPTEPPETEALTEPEPVIGIVYTPRLNIREQPGTGYATVGAYFSGEKVEILETKDGWGRTDKGWISMEYINLEKKPSTQDSSVGDDKEAIVGNGATEILGYGLPTLQSLNVRSGPGTNYKKIDTIKGGPH